MYKNQLQQYAQKQNIILPKYSCEVEGPPHACRFRSKVAFGGKIFESHEFFSTLKEAEQAAAKIALEALSPQEIQKVVKSPKFICSNFIRLWVLLYLLVSCFLYNYIVCFKWISGCRFIQDPSTTTGTKTGWHVSSLQDNSVWSTSCSNFCGHCGSWW